MAMEHGTIATTLQNAKEESEEIIYTVVEDLLKKAKVDPKEVMSYLRYPSSVKAACLWPTLNYIL